MKKPRSGNHALLALALACAGLLPASASAQISVGVGISLPPPIVFAAPPVVVVLPGFDIYVAPNVVEEVYFVDGFWWRPWQGRWYRSQSYDSGWGYYDSVPSFYVNVRQGWRDDYHNHQWEGQAWNYQPQPYRRVEQNWRSWKSNNYWEGQQNWGVPEMKGGRKGHDSRSSEPASKQGSGKAQRSGGEGRSSDHRDATSPQRSSQPKAATPKRQSSQPKAAAPKRQSSQPKASTSKHGGASAPKQKSNGGGGAPSQGGNKGGDKGGDNGGGKDQGKPQNQDGGKGKK